MPIFIAEWLIRHLNPATKKPDIFIHYCIHNSLLHLFKLLKSLYGTMLSMTQCLSLLQSFQCWYGNLKRILCYYLNSNLMIIFNICFILAMLQKKWCVVTGYMMSCEHGRAAPVTLLAIGGFPRVLSSLRSIFSYAERNAWPELPQTLNRPSRLIGTR